MEQVAARTYSRRAIVIGTIAAVHLLLTVALFFLSVGFSMSRFDGGGPSDATALLVDSAFGILSFPLVAGFQLLKISGTGAWGWLLFVGNSVLWGLVGWRAIRYLRANSGMRNRLR